MFFKDFMPRKFCREFVELKGNAQQLGMYMAAVLGLKPLMDDWIPKDKIRAFKAACKTYGLKVRENIVFVGVPRSRVPKDVVGRASLTTTSAYGRPLDSPEEGLVHVFVSRSEKKLKEGMWYPVIVKDRVISQPRADSLKYGFTLGYPACCIEFFKKYNDWSRFSHLYEVFVHTKGKPDLLCNPFLKDTAYSYIYHIPCSYDCPATRKAAGRLREEIAKREPEYVRLADQYLRMPFLVLYEKKFYCFEGSLADDEIKYSRAYFPSPDKTQDVYGKALRDADTLKLRGRQILVYRKGRLRRKFEVLLEGFAPEHPFLIQF